MLKKLQDTNNKLLAVFTGVKLKGTPKGSTVERNVIVLSTNADWHIFDIEGLTALILALQEAKKEMEAK